MASNLWLCFTDYRLVGLSSVIMTIKDEQNREQHCCVLGNHTICASLPHSASDHLLVFRYAISFARRAIFILLCIFFTSTPDSSVA